MSLVYPPQAALSSSSINATTSTSSQQQHPPSSSISMKLTPILQSFVIVTPPVPTIELNNNTHKSSHITTSSTTTTTTTNTNTICIGRNAITNITDTSLSRKLFNLVLNDKNEAWLHMQKNPNDHFCCLDDVPIRCNKGEFVRLKHGMIVSLWKEFYRYKIECRNPSNAPLPLLSSSSSNSHNPTTVNAASESSDDDEHDTTSSSSNTITTIQNTSRSNMVEECICSVCMDIMVNAHVSNPCGHVFCIDCVKELKNCPNCRTQVTSWIGMKGLDCLILNMVKRGDFDEDDVNHFLKRMPHVIFSENEWKCIHSTRENNIHPKSNTSKRKQPNTKLAQHNHHLPIKNDNHRPKKKRRTHHTMNHPPNPNNNNPQYLLSTTTSTSTMVAAAATTTTLLRSPPPEVVAVVPATDRERGKRRRKRNRVPSSSTSVVAAAAAAAIGTTGTAPNDAICVD